METRNSKAASSALPYINDFWSILITVAINVVCILAFNSNSEITVYHVLISAAICGVCTCIINVLLSYWTIKKMRRAGTLPPSVPESRFMMRLPLNPVLLILLFAVFFSAMIVLVNFAFVRFYEIQTFTLLRLVVWQSVYACLLAAIVSECAVLRFIQPDCSGTGDPAQTGTGKVANPMSRVNAFKNWLGTILMDFGFNMAIGLVLGATYVAADHSVVIKPTTREGIVGSAVVIGLIVTFRLALPIIKSIRGARDKGMLAPADKRSGFLSALPEKPIGLTLLLLLPIILLSYVVFWSVLTFFGFEILSFFQFFIIRSIYMAVLSKCVMALAMARYRQPKKGSTAACTA